MNDPEPQVMLEAVEATMSSPMLRDQPVEPEVAPARLPELPILPPIDVARTVARRVEFELAIAAVVVVAIVVAASYVAADVRVAIGVASLGFVAVGIKRIDRRVPFSFGEGFVGYRADLGWPHGIQEDDDVRWNWRSSTAGTGSPVTPQIPGSPPNRCAAER